MALSRPTTFAMGAVTALVLGSGTAYAATGGNFILGRSNSAGATTVLTNGNGSALSLNSRAGTPSLKVNRTTKVTNLNADQLDGLNSSSFARASGKVGTISGTGQYFDFNEDGTEDVVGAYAICPAGTKLVGGGGEDDTPGGALWLTESVASTESGPHDTWLIFSTTTPYTAT
jgi:hypothetical protein